MIRRLFTGGTAAGHVHWLTGSKRGGGVLNNYFGWSPPPPQPSRLALLRAALRKWPDYAVIISGLGWHPVPSSNLAPPSLPQRERMKCSPCPIRSDTFSEGWYPALLSLPAELGVIRDLLIERA